MSDHQPTILDFSLRLYLSKPHARALQFIAVEFSVGYQRIIEDALQLHKFLLQAREQRVLVWTSQVPSLIGNMPLASTSLTHWGNFAWQILRELSDKYVYYDQVTEFRVTSRDKEFIRYWSGYDGEMLERYPIKTTWEMLGFIYLVYFEYASGGYARSAVWQPGAEPRDVELQQYLGLYNTRPVI